ncbi:DUF6611 family protein [Arthrobacter cryoconiti]|uniref:DUF6611 family protein n=1 Tax=Arthrobacter cryoconiti TaxID=748907 RepID=A0ABV8R4D9_9MICC|nr:DUF6611 family protein [Arthrobacter cryoconiti]MCC9069322.1 hypothetical protein [Arthrobacter cryoconiti]
MTRSLSQAVECLATTTLKWGRFEAPQLPVSMATGRATLSLVIFPPGTTSEEAKLIAVARGFRTFGWVFAVHLGACIFFLFGGVIGALVGIGAAITLWVLGVTITRLQAGRPLQNCQIVSLDIRRGGIPSTYGPLAELDSLAKRFDDLDRNGQLTPAQYEFHWAQLYERAAQIGN